MSADFETLRAIVNAEPSVRNRLFSHVEPASFIAAVLRLAIERDLVIAEGEIWEAIEQGREAWYATWAP